MKLWLVCLLLVLFPVNSGFQLSHFRLRGPSLVNSMLQNEKILGQTNENVIASDQASLHPTNAPVLTPTDYPLESSTSAPTLSPTETPPLSTPHPSTSPVLTPSDSPLESSTSAPTLSPTETPTDSPLESSTSAPTLSPTETPTDSPLESSTSAPTLSPTETPPLSTPYPTLQPSLVVTSAPSSQPSGGLSMTPSSSPTASPSLKPSSLPTDEPSAGPSSRPSGQPSSNPTCDPSSEPSRQPTSQPSSNPTCDPSSQPSRQPTSQPSSQPSVVPISQPSSPPSSIPSREPIARPSSQPSKFTSQRTPWPTPVPPVPTSQPSTAPSSQPSAAPTSEPTESPFSVQDAMTSLERLVSNFTVGFVQSVGKRSSSNQLFFLSTTRSASQWTQTWFNFTRSARTLDLMNVPVKLVVAVARPGETVLSSVQVAAAECSDPSPLGSLWTAFVYGQEMDVVCNSTVWRTQVCDESTVSSSSPSSRSSVCFFLPSMHLSVPNAVSSSSSNRQSFVQVLTVQTSRKQSLWPQWDQEVQSSIHSISVKVRLSRPGTIRCGAFFATSAPFSSVLAISQLSVSSSSLFLSDPATLTGTMTMSSLPASTNYSVYCYTSALYNYPNAISMSPLSQSIQRFSSVSTSCCSVTVVNLVSPVGILSTTASPTAISVSVTSFSSEVVTVFPRLLYLGPNYCSSYPSISIREFSARDASLLPVVPSSLVFQSRFGSNQKSNVFISATLPGCFALTALVSESSNSTFIVKTQAPDDSSSSSSSSVSSSVLTLTSLVTPTVESMQVLSASFVNQASQLVVTFNFESDVGSATSIFSMFQSFPCSVLMSFPSSADSECVFTSSSLLIVYLPLKPSSSSSSSSSTSSSSSLPVVGDSLTVLGGLLGPACVLSSTVCSTFPSFPAATVSITSLITTKPSVIISAPSQIYSGQVLTVDVSSSAGNGGREWVSVVWTVHSDATNSTVISDLVRYLNSMKWFGCTPKTTDCDTIPASLLSVPGWYLLTLDLKNFLGASSSSRISINVLNTPPAPQVSILGPKTLYVHANNTLSLESRVSNTESSVGTLSYTWLVFCNNQLDTTLEDVSVNDVRRFVLSPHALKEKHEYRFQVSVAALSAADSTVLSLDEVVVYVLPGEIVPVITDSADRTLSVLDPLILDASSSYFTSLGHLSSTDIQNMLLFEWTCTKISPVDPLGCEAFFDSANKIIEASALSSPITDVTLGPVVVAPTISLDSCVDILTPSSTFVFTVFVSSLLDPAQSGSASITVHTTDHLAVSPVIQILAPSVPIDNSQSTAISGWVGYSSPFEVSWIVPALNKTIFSKQFPAGSFNVPLLISKNAFQFPKGVSQLSFVLSVTVLECTWCSPTLSRILVTVNDPPVSGFASSSPLIGSVLDQYTIFASNWQDDNLPLTYSFFQTSNEAGGSPLLIRQQSVVTYTSTFLSAGKADNSSSTCIVTNIMDSLSGASTYSFFMQVKNLFITNTSSTRPSFALMDDTMQLVESAWQQASDQRDANAFLSVNNVITNFVGPHALNCSAYSLASVLSTTTVEDGTSTTSSSSSLFNSTLSQCTRLVYTGMKSMRSLLDYSDEDKDVVSSVAMSLSAFTSSSGAMHGSNTTGFGFELFQRITKSSVLSQFNSQDRNSFLDSYLSSAQNLAEFVVSRNAIVASLPANGTDVVVSQSLLNPSRRLMKDSNATSPSGSHTLEFVQRSVESLMRSLLSGIQLGEAPTVSSNQIFEAVIGKGWGGDLNLNRDSNTSSATTGELKAVLTGAAGLAKSVTAFGFFQLTSRATTQAVSVCTGSIVPCQIGDNITTEVYLMANQDNITVHLNTSIPLTSHGSELLSDMLLSRSQKHPVAPSTAEVLWTWETSHNGTLNTLFQCSPNVTGGPAHLFNVDSSFAPTQKSLNSSTLYTFTCPLYSDLDQCVGSGDQCSLQTTTYIGGARVSACVCTASFTQSSVDGLVNSRDSAKLSTQFGLYEWTSSVSLSRSRSMVSPAMVSTTTGRVTPTPTPSPTTKSHVSSQSFPLSTLVMVGVFLLAFIAYLLYRFRNISPTIPQLDGSEFEDLPSLCAVSCPSVMDTSGAVETTAYPLFVDVAVGDVTFPSQHHDSSEFEERFSDFEIVIEDDDCDDAYINNNLSSDAVNLADFDFDLDQEVTLPSMALAPVIPSSPRIRPGRVVPVEGDSEYVEETESNRECEESTTTTSIFYGQGNMSGLHSDLCPNPQTAVSSHSSLCMDSRPSSSYESGYECMETGVEAHYNYYHAVGEEAEEAPPLNHVSLAAHTRGWAASVVGLWRSQRVMPSEQAVPVADELPIEVEVLGMGRSRFSFAGRGQVRSRMN